MKKFMSQVSLCINAALVCSLLMPGKLNAQAQSNDTFKIGIAVTTRHLMELVEPVFAKTNPSTPVTSKIDETGNVVDAVIIGKASVAVTTRNLKDFEIKKSATVMGTPIGLDGLVVAVSSSVPVSNLSFEQIAGIYTGKFTNWNQVGGNDMPIFVIGRVKAYDPIQLFADFMQLDTKPLNGGIVYSEKGKNTWCTTIAFSPTTDDAALELLLQTPGAITYFPLQIFNNYHKKNKKLKALDFNGIKATNTTIASGEYFIHRRLNVMTNGTPTGVSKKFVEFMLSKKGQHLIRQAGFLSLKK
ncbi:MAG: substrate-binding domain-containing protein [Bacteroidota bacterium]